MGTMTAYYVTVQKMLSHVTANTLREFSLRTSDEDRVAYIMSQSFAENAFDDIKPTSSEGKSQDQSLKLREEGNKSYGRGDHKQALECYTRAVLCAPVTLGPDISAEEMVLAHGNRSATLFQLHRYKECLDDIAVALKYGYPEALRYKIYDRQGRCYMELEYFDKALEAFENVIKSLSDSKMDEQQQSNASRNTNKQIELCKLKLDTDGGKVHSPSPDKFGGMNDKPELSAERNKRYPQTSEAFSVKYSLEKGRYGVAAEDIKVGDTIISEDPFACVLDPSQYGWRCYHCFKTLTLPLGCYHCMRVRFCSDECRVSAWEAYHEAECPFLFAILSSGTGNITSLVLRTILITGLRKIIKYKNNPKSDQHDVQSSLFTDSKGVYIGGFVGLYGLLTHTSYRAPSELLQYTFLAVFILKILERSGFIQNGADLEGEFKDKETALYLLGGIILRFLQITACNGIEITEMAIGENLTKSHPETIGLAFFPTVCLINHSCDPVMELIFYENTCVVRALRNILSGQELTIDYGYLYYITTKQQRQLSLKAQYFFDCSCPACANNWSVKQNLPCNIPQLKCTECSTILSPFNNNASNLSNTDRAKGAVLCVKCQHQENTIEIIENLQKSNHKAAKALDEARSFQLLKAIPILEAHVSLMDKHVSLPWKDYVTATSMLKQCYRMMGNRARRNTSA